MPIHSGDTVGHLLSLGNIPVPLAYRRSLEVAAQLRAASAAFPAISTGIFGYPKERAAAVAVAAIGDFFAAGETPQSVYYVLFSEEDFEIVAAQAAREAKNQSPPNLASR